MQHEHKTCLGNLIHSKVHQEHIHTHTQCHWAIPYMPTNAMKTNCKWSHTCQTATETKNSLISEHNKNVDMKLTTLQITILTYNTLSKLLFQFLYMFTKQLQGMAVTFNMPVWLSGSYPHGRQRLPVDRAF